MTGQSLTVWHLSLLAAAWLLSVFPRYRRTLLIGGLVSLPVLFLVPILSQSYFGLFDPAQSARFFANQAIVVFALGVVMAAFYERIIRPKITASLKPPRHRYVVFTAGLVLSIVLFDLFSQPLMPSIVFGLGLNALLAIRYHPKELYDIVFAALLMGLFYLFVYAGVLFDLPGEAGRFWFLPQLSGVTLFGIAVEKVVTVFAFGAFWGPLYVGLKDVLATKD